VKVRDTAERDTPARSATSFRVTAIACLHVVLPAPHYTGSSPGENHHVVCLHPDVAGSRRRRAVCGPGFPVPLAGRDRRWATGCGGDTRGRNRPGVSQPRAKPAACSHIVVQAGRRRASRRRIVRTGAWAGFPDACWQIRCAVRSKRLGWVEDHPPSVEMTLHQDFETRISRVPVMVFVACCGAISAGVQHDAASAHDRVFCACREP